MAGARRQYCIAMAPEVLINARAAARPELGGVERWARELEHRLPELSATRYAVARPPSLLSHRAGHLWEQTVLPARRARLVLCPANLAPVASRRTVVVIHDVAPLRDPSWYSPAYVRWQRIVLPRIARHARAVIVPSEFSAGEVVSLLGVPDERVHVVPGGVDPKFGLVSTEDAAAARGELGLGDDRYVLAVASATSRKNLRVLDSAAPALAEHGVRVMLAGGDRPQFKDSARSREVETLGHVPDRLLPGLYAGAAAFALPSLYEGFGLTAVEAMAAGTPVVASDRTALPEVCGEYAIYADPQDAGAFTDALVSAIDGSAPDRDLAREHAGTFTWDRTARGVDAVVQSVLAEP